MPNKKFIRQDSSRHSKIGKNRKKLQKWRKPKGRDSKMRLKRKSYPRTVKVGYKSSRKLAGLVENKKPILIHNLDDLKKMHKANIAILAKIGARKKLEIIKEAKEKEIKILNVAQNPGGKK